MFALTCSVPPSVFPLGCGKEIGVKVDEAKTAYNARASEQMHRFLKSKTWEEKVKSIERMRAATQKARDATPPCSQAEGPADP